MKRPQYRSWLLGVALLSVWFHPNPTPTQFSRVLKGMLFGVTSSDALTFAGGVVVLGAVAIGACLVPALRASRIDPIRALRHE